MLRQFTKELPVTLTDAELRQYGQELASVVQDMMAEEDRQADIKAQLKARVLELHAKQTRLAGIVNSRIEYRPTLVDVIAVGGQMVSEVRTDTGEIIATRPMTEQERQAALDV